MENDFKVLNKYFKMFNQRLLMTNLDNLPINLFYGKMEICIYYFELANIEDNKDYYEFAEKLLDQICSQINIQKSFDVEEGLSGIALGIIYLNEKNYINADIDDVLSEIDDKIFQLINYSLQDSSIDQVQKMIKMLFYFWKRISVCKSYHDNQFVFKNLIIKIINYIENNISIEILIEPSVINFSSYYLPIYISVLSLIYKLDIFNSKILRILERHSKIVLSTIPIFHGHRLFFLLSINMALQNVKIKNWKEHANLLESSISITKIINDELKNRHIYFNNGLTGCYWIYKELKKNNLINVIEFRDEEILKKISNSLIWRDDFNSEEELVKHAGIVNGFAGIFLVFYEIINLYSYEEELK